MWGTRKWENWEEWEECEREEGSRVQRKKTEAGGFGHSEEKKTHARRVCYAEELNRCAKGIYRRVGNPALL
jgi:hypothetical protein